MPEEFDFYLDSNGIPTERRRIGGQEVIVHYDDLPETDVTTVHGIRVTTPIRTVIDLAPDMEGSDLESMINDALRRRLFTIDDAMARLAQPDMATRRGAELVRRVLRGITATWLLED